MKNKKVLTYLMLTVVVGIWGKIMYDIFAPKADNYVYAGITNNVESITDDLTLFEYELIADYRDPFLGKYKRSGNENRVVRSNRPAKQKPKVRVKATRKWPKLEYNGKMKNRANQDATVFVKINDKDFLMKVGESQNDIKLIKISTDSLFVEFDDEKRSIPYIGKN